MSNTVKKLGINCGYLPEIYGDMRTLEICAAAGFDSIDYDVHMSTKLGNIPSMTDEEMVDYYKNVKKRADELGIVIGQTHGLCVTFKPDDEEHNAKVVELSRRHLLVTAALGSPACVIHSLGTRRWRYADAETMHKKNLEMFDQFIPYAEKYGVALGIETFGDVREWGRVDFFGDIVEFKKQFDMLNTKNKVICVDTGHTHCAHTIEPSILDAPDAIRYLGKDIKILHLNDNNGFSDQHLPPYLAGARFQLDWHDVMAALDDIEYDGIYNFELMFTNNEAMAVDYYNFLGKHLRRVINGEI